MRVWVAAWINAAGHWLPPSASGAERGPGEPGAKPRDPVRQAAPAARGLPQSHCSPEMSKVQTPRCSAMLPKLSYLGNGNTRALTCLSVARLVSDNAPPSSPAQSGEGVSSLLSARWPLLLFESLFQLNGPEGLETHVSD